MLPKLRGQSPDYRETLGHYTSHDVVGRLFSVSSVRVGAGRVLANVGAWRAWVSDWQPGANMALATASSVVGPVT